MGKGQGIEVIWHMPECMLEASAWAFFAFPETKSFVFDSWIKNDREVVFLPHNLYINGRSLQ